MGGKPAPERASRGAGRGASTTDRAKLAPKLDATQRQADEHAGALLGLDAHTKHWATVIPPLAWAGGLASTLVIGAIAGLLPAVRAARMSPTQALWTM